MNPEMTEALVRPCGCSGRMIAGIEFERSHLCDRHAREDEIDAKAKDLREARLVREERPGP